MKWKKGQNRREQRERDESEEKKKKKKTNGRRNGVPFLVYSILSWSPRSFELLFVSL